MLLSLANVRLSVESSPVTLMAPESGQVLSDSSMVLSDLMVIQLPSVSVLSDPSMEMSTLLSVRLRA